MCIVLKYNYLINPMTAVQLLQCCVCIYALSCVRDDIIESKIMVDCRGENTGR